MITIPIDPTNPGQFFACCGLLELADRLWPGAEGWFNDDVFKLQCETTLVHLMTLVADAELIPFDPEDATASPMLLKLGASHFRLDWWKDESAGGRDMKVWAGSMESVGIARALAKRVEGRRLPNAGIDE